VKTGAVRLEYSLTTLDRSYVHMFSLDEQQGPKSGKRVTGLLTNGQGTVNAELKVDAATLSPDQRLKELPPLAAWMAAFAALGASRFRFHHQGQGSWLCVEVPSRDLAESGDLEGRGEAAMIDHAVDFLLAVRSDLTGPTPAQV
jgi:hypothetical protein